MEPPERNQVAALAGGARDRAAGPWSEPMVHTGPGDAGGRHAVGPTGPNSTAPINGPRAGAPEQRGGPRHMATGPNGVPSVGGDAGKRGRHAPQMLSSE